MNTNIDDGLTLTKYDLLFLDQLRRTSTHNRMNKGDNMAIRTSKLLLSPGLLAFFEVDGDNKTGQWMFNVYVEFDHLFHEHPAEDWQK